MTNIEDRRYIRFFPLAVLLVLPLPLVGSAGQDADRAGAQSANGLETRRFDDAYSAPSSSRPPPTPRSSRSSRPRPREAGPTARR